MGHLLYLAIVKFYVGIVYVLSPFNKRAKELIAGQEQWFSKLQNQLANNSKQIAWFHCASLGEFEQGKPVMKALKNQGYAILVTFFSPSGFKYRHHDKEVDFYSYLPFDSKANAEKLIKLIKPKVVLWVKYDFWFSYLYELHKQAIPMYLISALFQPHQIFFKWYGSYAKKHLLYFNRIFCQNHQSVALLHKHNIKNAMYAGDTRFDNVWEKHKTNQVANEILAFSKDNRKIIIAGSSYKIEEDLLAGVLNNKQNKLIVAPHFISEERIKEIERIFKTFKVTRFSKALTINNLAEYDVLILDNIGNLTSAYAVATIAFIGGGFRKGNLHNILEPSVFGLRICFGPLIDKFPEAQAMIELGLAKIIKNRKDLADFLAEPNHNIKEKIKAFIEHQLGSTEIIIKNIKA